MTERKEIGSATLATIDRWLQFRVWHSEVPGAQVAIGLGGELIFSHSYGYADLYRREPMRTDHLFRIASHSKTFTATRILQLVEQDRLQLEDRLGDRLPEFDGHEVGEVVIRELLEHTAGVLRDGTDGDFWQGNGSFPQRTDLTAMALAGLKRSPGELFAYSNVGYGLLGAVIESITGQPFADDIQAHIIDPLGLTHTSGRFLPERVEDYATGYSGLSTAIQRAVIDPVDTRALDAAAGCTSTAEDLVSYFSAHAFGDSRLVGDRAKRLMQRSANLTDPRRTDGPTYGLGMAGESFGDHWTTGHGGGFPGHITRTLLDPRTGLVIAALTNAIDGPASSLASGVLKIIDDAQAHPADASAEGDLAAWTGRWRSVWSVVDIGVVGGRLLAIDPTRWEPVDDVDVLEVADDRRLRIAAGGGYGSVAESVTFSDDQDGHPSMRYGSMTFAPFDELPEREVALG